MRKRLRQAQACGHVDDLLPYKLNRLVDIWNRELTRRLREQGYSFAEWRILAVLGGRDGLTMNALVERTLIPQSTLSRLVDRMAAARLVERRSDPRDGRSVVLYITGKGRTAYEVVWPIAQGVAQELLDALAPSARSTLTRIVDQLLAFGRQRR